MIVSVAPVVHARALVAVLARIVPIERQTSALLARVALVGVEREDTLAVSAGGVSRSAEAPGVSIRRGRKPPDDIAGAAGSQCTNVLTSEKAISPDPVIDQTRQAHSPRVDHSWPAETRRGTLGFRRSCRNRRASS